jgi:hypothetical protein
VSGVDPAVLILPTLGLVILVVGAACVVISGWVVLTGRRPIWLRRRQSLPTPISVGGRRPSA